MHPCQHFRKRTQAAGTKQGSPKLPFYRVLWVPGVAGHDPAVALGYWRPEGAVAVKSLGDTFIRLITMIITLIIFCTAVTGIAGMENLKKVSCVGGMTVLYFEVVSTLALPIGLLVGNVVHPGSGFRVLQHVDGRKHASRVVLLLRP